MTEAEFQALAQAGYNRIPLVQTLLADLDTPLAVYAKLAQGPYTFLLESVQGGERFGRYSFVGLPATTRLRITGHTVCIEQAGQATETLQVSDPLAFVAAYRERFKVAPLQGLPRFCGGLAGYFGYDIVRYIEPRLAQGWKDNDTGITDILLLLTTELVVIDNLSGQLHLIVYAESQLPQAFAQARARLEQLHQQLRQPAVLPPLSVHPLTPAQSDQTPQDHQRSVARAKAYIAQGDIMQVVLSRRIRQPFAAPPLTLYRALRRLNPSPYMFYYDFGDFQVVGASPEILVRLEEDRVTVRPIAGTRPRGSTPEQDQTLAQELLSDPKEIAEHVMLIDLGRNDVGRIAQTGSVEVTERMIIERYSHVMHIVSNVE